MFIISLNTILLYVECKFLKLLNITENIIRGVILGGVMSETMKLDTVLHKPPQKDTHRH